MSGWQLRGHPVFLQTYHALEDTVDRIRARDPERADTHPSNKLLRRIVELTRDEIPADPAAHRYALGNALGPEHRHWRRAKFLGRFRLFFRYAGAPRIIIYGWVNDEASLRRAGSRTDPYVVFDGMLKSGRPPDDWDRLMAEARGLGERR